MRIFFFFFPELLRSCWNASGVNLDHEQGTCSLCGKIFFMSETEHAYSRLCHPVFSRQKIPKNPHPRSFCLADSATGHSKCLLTSTAMCRTSSTATRCPVWLPRYLFPIRPFEYNYVCDLDSGFCPSLFIMSCSFLWLGGGQREWNQDSHCQHGWCCKGIESASNMWVCAVSRFM